MQGFLSESLRKIHKQSSKKQKDLRDGIDKALAELVQVQEAVQAGAEVKQQIMSRIGLVFEPFCLACDSKNAKMASYGLDCIGKLMEHAFLADDGGLVDRAVECVCDCFQIADDEIQLQIIQVLLNGVMVPTSNVHEGSLLTTVRTVYNIYLNSRNVTNVGTAHTAMQQMLDKVYERMEAAVRAAQPSQADHPASVYSTLNRAGRVSRLLLRTVPFAGRPGSDERSQY